MKKIICLALMVLMAVNLLAVEKQTNELTVSVKIAKEVPRNVIWQTDFNYFHLQATDARSHWNFLIGPGYFVSDNFYLSPQIGLVQKWGWNKEENGAVLSFSGWTFFKPERKSIFQVKTELYFLPENNQDFYLYIQGGYKISANRLKDISIYAGGAVEEVYTKDDPPKYKQRDYIKAGPYIGAMFKVFHINTVANCHYFYNPANTPLRGENFRLSVACYLY